MILMHYADAPVTLDRTRTYEPRNPGKPAGFWVSVQGDDDWPSWCRDEQWGVGRLACAHTVALADDANLLLIDTYEGVKGVLGRYTAPRQPWHVTPWPDWQAIALDYDGIIIAPYQWEARWNPDTHWYYGWDCASGCIWNLDAIASLTPVPYAATERCPSVVPGDPAR